MLPPKPPNSIYLRPPKRRSPLQRIGRAASAKLINFGRWCANPYRIYKIAFTIFCIVGYLYQTGEVLWGFLTYETSVYTVTQLPDTANLPSVSYCIPSYFSQQKLLEIYGDELKAELDAAEAKVKKKANATVKAERQARDEVFRRYQKLSISNMTVHELLNRTTRLEDRNVSCMLYSPPEMLRLNETETMKVEKEGMACDSIMPVVESINSGGKCFTYFSQVGHATNEEMKVRVLKRAFVVMVEVVKKEYEDVFLDVEDDLACFQVHKPNQLPLAGCTHKIEPGYIFNAFVTRKKALLMTAPFRTDCRHYFNSSDFGANSQVACQLACRVAVYERRCGCLPRSFRAWRGNTPPDIAFCAGADDCRRRPADWRQCEAACKTNCVDRHYQARISKQRYPSDARLDGTADTQEFARLMSLRFTKTIIRFYQESLSDVTFEHRPAMTLVTLVCSLGGLGGIWLGISVLTVSNWLISSPKSPLSATKRRRRPPLSMIRGSAPTASLANSFRHRL